MAARWHAPIMRAKGRKQDVQFWLIAASGAVLIYGSATIFGVLNEWPRELEFYPAAVMNDGLTYLIVNFRDQIDAIKEFAFFFIMLPSKIGVQRAVSPFTSGLNWGSA